MNEKALNEWFKLTGDTKKNIFSEIADRRNLPAAAIEKDWWASDQDPVTIEVNYFCVTEKSAYLPSRVLIEIGSRSLIEPFATKNFCSIVGEDFRGREFADVNINIPTVNPERTFLEKMFLIHEQLQQQEGKIKVNRLSRHLYDLEKLMDTEHAKKALEDKGLYTHIVEHRKTITPIRGIDYGNHIPSKINIIPPANSIVYWQKDYDLMKENMFYSEILTFDKLMERITELNGRINKINHS